MVRLRGEISTRKPMTIPELLDRSSASGPFRDAVLRFLREGTPCATVSFDAGAPPVKVERTLVKALLEYPEHPIESIELRARSGCESFRGTLVLHGGGEARRVAFHWDCRWRAEQEGWRDWFGFPDQARAAREFGWDCFREWSEVEAPAGAGEPVPA
jgi:hypothetical protein